jgi:hypothetical protein
MQYNSNSDTIAKYLRRWRLQAYFPFAVFAILGFLYGGNIYHEKGAASMWTYLIAFAVLGTIIVRPLFRILASSNILIDSIDLSNENISFSTHEFRVLGGLIHARALHIRATKDEITVRPGLKKNDSVNKYLLSTYRLTVAGKGYLLAEGLFDDFDSLKSELETFIGHPITSIASMG